MSEPTLREILDAINGLGTRLDRVEQRLDGLEQKVGQGFDSVLNMLGSLSINHTRLEGKVDRLAGQVGVSLTEAAD